MAGKRELEKEAGQRQVSTGLLSVPMAHRDRGPIPDMVERSRGTAVIPAPAQGSNKNTAAQNSAWMNEGGSEGFHPALR